MVLLRRRGHTVRCLRGMPLTYRVNEVMYTIQGEGFWSGRAAVFVRLSGCNLWSGLEKDRATAICTFCDTDFVDGTVYDLKELITEIGKVDNHCGFVVLTGGEPGLQIDGDLIDELHNWGYYIAVETNGTKPLPVGVDWICVSPKTPTIRQVHGDEMKLVYPQKIRPEWFESHDFDHFWLSPMDGPNLTANTAAAVDYVHENPRWRLNTQTHKQIGIR